MPINLEHLTLSSLGNFFPLDIKFYFNNFFQELKPFEDQWKVYNPRKPGYNRYGLSLFSLDGQMTGIPDLDSISEYNKENATDYCERSFSQPTDAWRSICEISQPLLPIQQSLVRSHIIKLMVGGFFPPHRDLGQAFRLISILGGSQESLHLTVDGRLCSFTPGHLYFLDTHKTHSVVSFKDNMYIVVFNVMYDKDAVEFVISHRLEK